MNKILWSYALRPENGPKFESDILDVFFKNTTCDFLVTYNAIPLLLVSFTKGSHWIRQWICAQQTLIQRQKQLWPSSQIHAHMPTQASMS